MPTFSTADSSVAERTRPTADGTVKVTPETPLPTSAPIRSKALPPLSVCPVNQQSPDRRREGSHTASNRGTETRLEVRGFEPSDKASNHCASPPTTTATVTAVFSPSVAASRSAARVDGSQLHMRLDPARSPIDRQRTASLQFPGFGARWVRLDTSIALRTKKTRDRHGHQHANRDVSLLGFRFSEKRFATQT